MSTATRSLSPERIRTKLLAICEEANYVADLISELAPYAHNPHDALLLSAKAREIAVFAIGPNLFAHVFAEAAKRERKK
jgi:hypothetical protein